VPNVSTLLGTALGSLFCWSWGHRGRFLLLIHVINANSEHPQGHNEHPEPLIQPESFTNKQQRH